MELDAPAPEEPEVVEGEVVDDDEGLAPWERDWPRPWQAPFLRALSVVAEVSSACRVARISQSSVYATRDAHPDFAEAWAEAQRMSRDAVERQAHAWIMTGVPVRSTRTVTRRKTDAQGNVLEVFTEEVTTETAERSAALMIFWLKAHHPDRYRFADRHEISGEGGGPIKVENLDELDRRIAALTAELEARAGGDPVPPE